MKKAETKKAKEQSQNVERVGKKMGEVGRMDNVLPRHRRAAFGDLTNEQPQDQGTKQKKPDGLKKTKQVTAKVKVTAKNNSVAVTVGKKPKAAVSAPNTARTEPDGAELPALNQQLSEVAVEDSHDVLLSSQESTSSSAATGSVDVSMSESGGSTGLDDSRMSLEQSIHESSMMNDDEMPDIPIEDGVEDVDSENKDDISYAALYVHDIFNYYKEREKQFLLEPYLDHQPHLSASMRAILVDWLVEVQENFELNHETLYLAVKLTDAYLSLIPSLPRDQLQLVGASALFVSCKFDERLPPAVEDFLYVCDDAYKKPEFLAMERDLLRTIGFDLGRPISYRFLRRYAKCGRSPIVTLTLARYLLELSLMEYKFVSYRESVLAAACLFIARRMQREEGWTKTLEFYTGYRLAELQSTVLELNPLLTSNHYSHLTTIRTKYNHVVFHSVGKIPTLTNEELFPIAIPQFLTPTLLKTTCRQEVELGHDEGYE